MATKHPYHYRSKAGSTQRARERFHNVPSVGKLLSVKGYRFVSNAEGVRTDRERVQVRGELGTATYDGLCWGYGGEGPRGLVDLLELQCRIPRRKAEMVAFAACRGDKSGTDWEVDLRKMEFRGRLQMDRLA